MSSGIAKPMLSTIELFQSSFGPGLFGWGEGVRWTLQLDPPLVPNLGFWMLVTLLLWGVSLGVSWQGLRRIPGRLRVVLAGVKFLTLVLLMLMLCRASLSTAQTGQPVLAVVVDTSASMSLADDYSPDVRRLIAPYFPRGQAFRRIDPVHHLLSSSGQNLLQELQGTHQVDAYTLSEQLEQFPLPGQADLQSEEAPLRFSPTGKRTDLKGGMSQLLDRYRGAPPTGVLLLTDGNSTAGPGSQLSEGARQLARRGIPLFVVGVGSTEAIRDLEVSEVLTDSVAFVGDRHLFQVRLSASRVNSGKTVVLLTPSGGSEVLDSREVTFRNGESSYTIELSHSPDRGGPLDYDVVVKPVTGEANLQNNRAQARVWAREARLKVLLVERAPRWEYRHVKAVLERDKTTDLKTWLQEADAQYALEDQTALNQLPESLEALAEYDALLWGDVDPSQLPGSLLAAVPEFVNKLGGGLLLVPGGKFLNSRNYPEGWAPLLLAENGDAAGEGLEISRQGLKLSRTAEGRIHPLLKLDEPGRDIVWSQVSQVFGRVPSGTLRKSTQILLEGVETGTPDVRVPLLVSQRFGSGVIVLQLFDETWRWRSLEQGLPFRRYWSQMVRFLSRRKAIDDQLESILKVDRTSYFPGETARLSLELSMELDDEMPPTVTIQSPAGVSTELPLTLSKPDESYFGELEGLEEGTYQARLTSPVLPAGQPAASWTVVAQDPERMFQPMNRADLQKAAELTSGRYFEVWEADRIPESIPLSRSPVILRQLSIPLWQRWELVLLLAGGLILEWALRKRYRLV